MVQQSPYSDSTTVSNLENINSKKETHSDPLKLLTTLHCHALVQFVLHLQLHHVFEINQVMIHLVVPVGIAPSPADDAPSH